MIAIRINRTDWLELPNDIQLDITRVSPVFSEDKVFEENSVYNFTVPGSPKNNALLGHPQRAMALRMPTEKKGIEIFEDNRLVGEGTVYVANAKKSIELVAGLSESSFAAAHGSKLITSFEYGGTMTYRDEYNTESTSILQVCNGVFPEYPFAYFPIKNLNLFDGSQWETGWKTDLLSRPFQNDYIAMAYDPVNEIYKYKTGHVSVTPFPYVGFIIEEIFKECGYTIDYNVFRHDNNLQRLCIYNPNVIFSVGPNRDYFYIDMAHHLPKMTVSEFLKAIKKPFAISFFINETTKTVSIRTFNQLKDSRLALALMYSEGPVFETSKKVKFKVPVDGSDSHAQLRQKPDEIEKSRYRGMVYILSDLSTILNPLEGDTALVLSPFEFYQYNPGQSGAFSWQPLCYNIQNTVADENNEEESEYALEFTGVFPEINEILTPLTAELITVDTMLSDINLGYTTNNWATPIVEIVGNKKNKPMEPSLAFNDFGLKLMMYWGIGPMLDGPLSYPKGSSTIYEYESVNPSGRFLSLFPNHDFNFVDRYLNRYQLTLTNRRVKTVYVSMSISQLNNLDWLETILHDGRIWLITSIKYKISNSGVSIAELELTEVN